MYSHQPPDNKSLGPQGPSIGLLWSGYFDLCWIRLLTISPREGINYDIGGEDKRLLLCSISIIR